ncbi:MAG: YggT family protein [Candidatus Chloroheliales bacterium]|nr:MAG: YggT family protein [Chloroflexota bacterium]PZS01403.1 MAG: YggT family protein [Chloroflexota bacterium]
MQIIALIIQVLTLLVFVRAIASWIVPLGSNAEWYRILFVSTEWLLAPIRNLMQRAMGNVMIDFSPIVAILLLQFIGSMLLR